VDDKQERNTQLAQAKTERLNKQASIALAESPAPIIPRVDDMAEARASAKLGIDSDAGAAEIAALEAKTQEAKTQEAKAGFESISAAIVSTASGGLIELIAAMMSTLAQIDRKAEATSQQTNKLTN